MGGVALYKKTVNGNVYWYLREMARVDGKPKMVSERYLGSAKEIERLLDAREAAVVPEKTRHLGFGVCFVNLRSAVSALGIRPCGLGFLPFGQLVIS